MHKEQTRPNNLYILKTIDEEFKKRVDKIASYRRGVMPKISRIQYNEYADMDWGIRDIKGFGQIGI